MAGAENERMAAVVTKLRSLVAPEEMQADPLRDKLSLKEVSGLLGLSERSVRRWLPYNIIPKLGIRLESILDWPVYSVGTARKFLGLSRGKMRRLIRERRIKLSSWETNHEWMGETIEFYSERITLREMIRVLGEELTYSNKGEIPDILLLARAVDEDALIEHPER
jgi:hypothetical protein